MDRDKAVCIIGARPQFIKHFPLEVALAKHFDVLTIHTGQHYDPGMSDVFFSELNIRKPTYHLALENRSHGGQTGEILAKVEGILNQESPKLVLVYGDTNSTLAGALAAVKLHIPVVHIEAGLRSYNRTMPEEVNRVLTDHMSDLLFCSSSVGIKNLRREGITVGVHQCGDLMKDALFATRSSISTRRENSGVLLTLHRPYNTDNVGRLKYIIEFLSASGKNITFPIHPRTENILKSDGFEFEKHGNLKFTKPLGYVEMVSKMISSEMIITDSGGIQKEAYWLKKRCVTIRTETEWVETLEGHWNQLVFENLERIDFEVVPDDDQYEPDLYGDGKSAEAIADAINEAFN